MPIFDHRCKTCGYSWEGFVHSSSPNPACRRCGRETEHVFIPPSGPKPEGRRLLPEAEIKKRVTGNIRELNKRLLDVSNRLAVKVQKHEIATTPQGMVLVALFKKAVNTFRGIQTLKTNRLIEESWILLRVLLEAHINLIYFLKNDGAEMTQRWLDAAMLEKLKYMKEVNFFEKTGLAHMGNRARWDEFEAKVAGRYSKDQLKAMRRNGYSGLSVEKRADAIGLIHMYQDCYRIASRSVHAFDPAETGLMDILDDEATVNELRAARRESLESMQNFLLGRLAFLTGEIVKDPFITMQLFLLGVGYEKYRDKKDGPRPKPEPDAIYIWRE